MNSSFKMLEQLFSTQKPLSKKELFAFFDEAGIPENVCWRTIYRMIFDSDLDLHSKKDMKLAKRHFEPVMEKALNNAYKGAFTEKALVSLIKEYNSIIYSAYHQQITNALDDLEKLTGEFKSISEKRQKEVKTLEIDTVQAVESDIPIDEKIRLIKSKFKKTISMYQKDIIQLDRMSRTDHLTGVYNKRFFDDQMEAEIIQALSEKTWLNLIMLDIDNFKQFNDRYGHLVGDQALKTIAKNIISVCDEESQKAGLDFFPTRYGGEEFAVILPAVDQGRAMEIAEMIRTRIADYVFIIRNKEGKIKHKNLSLTVSIGLASLDHSFDRNTGLEAIIKFADSAMYEAKKSGKNCLKVGRAPND